MRQQLRHWAEGELASGSVGDDTELWVPRAVLQLLGPKLALSIARQRDLDDQLARRGANPHFPTTAEVIKIDRIFETEECVQSKLFEAVVMTARRYAANH